MEQSTNALWSKVHTDYVFWLCFFLCRPDKLSDRSCKGRDQRHAKVSEKIIFKQSIKKIIGEALLNLRTEYISLIEVNDAPTIAANHFCE